MNFLKTFLAFAILIMSITACSKKERKILPLDHSKWNEFQGSADRNQFSTLDQVTLENVKDLKVAWSHGLDASGQMQMNPIIIEGILYGIGPDVRPFALNASTGEPIWTHGDGLSAWHSTSRGVAYWASKNDKRIYYGMGSYLYAIDAQTGKTVKAFANKGKLDLHKGLPDIAKDKFIVSNAPGTVYKNLIIVPVRMSEGNDAAPGDIRAFDIRTGEIVWTFHTIPYPEDEHYHTWENKDAYKNTNVGAVNNWCGMTLDREAKILFVPLGSASPDYYGGNRLGNNLYANCL